MRIFALTDNKWSQASKKAADPHMVLNGNPLREIEPDEQRLRSRNMERLHQDAAVWDDPLTGHIYRAIRGMTIDRGE